MKQMNNRNEMWNQYFNNTTDEERQEHIIELYSALQDIFTENEFIYFCYCNRLDVIHQQVQFPEVDFPEWEIEHFKHCIENGIPFDCYGMNETQRETLRKLKNNG